MIGKLFMRKLAKRLERERLALLAVTEPNGYGIGSAFYSNKATADYVADRVGRTPVPTYNERFAKLVQTIESYLPEGWVVEDYWTSSTFAEAVQITRDGYYLVFSDARHVGGDVAVYISTKNGETGLLCPTYTRSEDVQEVLDDLRHLNDEGIMA